MHKSILCRETAYWPTFIVFVFFAALSLFGLGFFLILVSIFSSLSLNSGFSWPFWPFFVAVILDISVSITILCLRSDVGKEPDICDEEDFEVDEKGGGESASTRLCLYPPGPDLPLFLREKEVSSSNEEKSVVGTWRKRSEGGWRTHNLAEEGAGAESQKEGDEVEEQREGKAEEEENKETDEEREQGREELTDEKEDGKESEGSEEEREQE